MYLYVFAHELLCMWCASQCFVLAVWMSLLIRLEYCGTGVVPYGTTESRKDIYIYIYMVERHFTCD